MNYYYFYLLKKDLLIVITNISEKKIKSSYKKAKYKKKIFLKTQ